MVAHGKGTILTAGAICTLRVRAQFAGFSATKAGLHAVAQIMTREFGPKDIHVVRVIIDGGISGDRFLSRFPQMENERGTDGVLSIDVIAERYWQLHVQHRSAWTLEQNLRPRPMLGRFRVAARKVIQRGRRPYHV